MRRRIADTPGREKGPFGSVQTQRDVGKEGPMRYPKATRTALTAPTGKFRVLGVVVEEDSADVYTVGDFSSVATAEQAAMQRAGIGSPVYVYDDKAKLIVRYGSWH